MQLKASDQEDDIVGVLIDADEDLPDRWQSIRSILVDSGYENVPDLPCSDGTILDAPNRVLLPRAGIWIMPDNQVEGILETFLRFLIPQPSDLFDYVQKSVKCIPDSERRFNPSKQPKAIIHTWLAWQKEPGMPPGLAISAHFLDSNVAEVDILVSWLNRLYYSP